VDRHTCIHALHWDSVWTISYCDTIARFERREAVRVFFTKHSIAHAVALGACIVIRKKTSRPFVI